MADNSPISSTPPGKVDEDLQDMKIENSDEEILESIKVEPGHNDSEHTQSASRSPIKREGVSQQADSDKELLGGDITVKMEPGQQTPKLVRSSTKKVKPREPPRFDHLPDSTPEATSTFSVIDNCSYSPKYLGDTEHAMECDCVEEWDGAAKVNRACGEDSDCINRATKMECVGDCACGALCENQRFQRRQYAKVSVIKTEMKGHGLRTDSDLEAGDFIYEYIGEVINEPQFRKRTIQYDEQGIKHFYFMSLSKGEFVDATKKGNLGRFCNHSCNPNCYVDKWVVGSKLRMGIFAERKIKAGEELVFNYNVDRYGADPQPCYCGEPNCTGVIGGKTQTERATKLSNTTIEALGIDDGDGWDTAVAKRPRKKKAGEDDEEYVSNVQPKSLDEDSVTKVMATLMQCKEKWIAVKLLGRIQRCDEERVINRVVKMHGYQIMNTTLTTWKEDFNVVLQVFDILNRFPRLTKNKITDSKIEGTVEGLQACGDERVETQAAGLLQEWSTLETAYRIPRKKRDPNAVEERQGRIERRDDREDKPRRSRSRSKDRPRSRSKSFDAPRGPSASSIPTGPRASQPQRGYFGTNRPQFRPQRPAGPVGALPAGWWSATTEEGRHYFYNARGERTWQRPTAPAVEPPPPPKPTSATKALDDIINGIVTSTSKTPELTSSNATPRISRDESKPSKKEGQEKWRSYSAEKQRKIYENTLFPPVKSVVDKYKHKLPKEDLKRFFKEVLKKLVASDYKNNRVHDPTKISEKQEKQVKSFVKAYFDKAVAKRPDQDKKQLEIQSQRDINGASAKDETMPENDSDKDIRMNASDDEHTLDGPTNSGTPITPLDSSTGSEGLKRKRVETDIEPGLEEGDIATPNKRARSETPPVPPPPPPAGPASEGESNSTSLNGSPLPNGTSANDLPFTKSSYDVSYRTGSNLASDGNGVTNGDGDSMEDMRPSSEVYVNGREAS